ERKAEEVDGQAIAAETAFAAVAPQLMIRRADAPTLSALTAVARRLEQALSGLDARVERIEAPLRARGEAGAERTGELGERLRASEASEQARAAETARVDAAVRAGRRRARPHELARVVAAAERLDEALLAAAGAAARFEAPLREDVDAGAARSGQLGAELRRLGAAEVELRQEL